MADFTMRVAGRTAAVRSMFESTRDYFESYLTKEAADFSVVTTKEDLEFEQAQSIEEARLEGFRLRIFPDPYLERASIQRKFAEHLLEHNTVLFHGSAVAVDRQGYLFTAKSGTGKSTHTRLWREVFGTRAVMINDDKPFIRITQDALLVCGSPWSGKHGLDTNISVPLKGICLLERSKQNRICPIGPEDAFPMLLKQTYQPMDPGRMPKCIELVNALARRAALWRMECSKEPVAATVSYEAMSRAGGDPPRKP